MLPRLLLLVVFQMTTSYAAMFGFGIVLLGSWAGWGVAIHRLVSRRVPASRGMHAGWGLALTVLVGGLLNLVGEITPISILLFIFVGLVLFVWDGYRHRRRLMASFCFPLRRLTYEWPLAAIVTAVSGVLLVVAYAASICSTSFNPHDDLQGYFVFPAKMIQTGALGPDPYSERRLLSLGGMSFLHAIVLSVADPRFFRLVDPGVSLLLSVALLAGMARVARTNGLAGMLAIFVFLLVPPPAANTTSSMTGLSLFLVLFLTLYRTSLHAPRGDHVRLLRAVPIALTASALCSLKTTHLPAATLLILAVYSVKVARSPRTRGSAVGEAALVMALTFLFLTPWMVSLYRSNGTPFYPLLGGGFQGSGYYWSPARSLTLSTAVKLLKPSLLDLEIAPLIILGVGASSRGDLGARRWILVGWALAATASYLAIPLVLGGVLPRHRHSYAFVSSAIFTLVMFVFPGRHGGRRKLRQWRYAWFVGTFAAGVLALPHALTARTYWRSLLTAIDTGVEASENPSFKQKYARRYASMQHAIPEGATVLTRLQYPFVLDFTRNEILIVDYPGGSSPPPGMPFFQGADRLAEYLCGESIRYVAYSYRLKAGFYDELVRERLSPGTEPWPRQQALHTQDFQGNLSDLGRTRKRLYDDGDVFVLDLSISSDGRALTCLPS